MKKIYDARTDDEKIKEWKDIVNSYPENHPETIKIDKQIEELKKKNVQQIQK